MLKSASGTFDIVSYSGYAPLAKEQLRTLNLTTKAGYAVPVLLDSTSMVAVVQVAPTTNEILIGKYIGIEAC